MRFRVESTLLELSVDSKLSAGFHQDVILPLLPDRIQGFFTFGCIQLGSNSDKEAAQSCDSIVLDGEWSSAVIVSRSAI